MITKWKRKRPQRPNTGVCKKTKMSDPEKDNTDGFGSISTSDEDSPAKSNACFMKEMSQKIAKLNRNIVKIQDGVKDSVENAIAL